MKLAIIIPCYNARKTLPSVFERIPQEIWDLSPEVIVVEDGGSEVEKSIDQTLIDNYPNITVETHSENRGYGAAQKTGYKKALELGADIMALLHADGQYAPEELPTLIAPLRDNEADVVMGSRMLDREGALQGNMPYYKYISNLILTKIENLFLRSSFSEFHSGYMLYSERALNKINLDKLTDKFHFDGEMLFVSKIKKFRVKEISIPTYYGEEVSYLNPVSYGIEIGKTLLKYLTGHYHRL